MSDIIYPTLDLFLYDLRIGLGETAEEVNQSKINFQKKLPESVRPLMLQEDKDFEVEYAELLVEDKTADFEAVSNSYSLEGYIYPVRINDVYVLLVDCSVNDAYSPQPAECFATLKAEIEQNTIQGEQPTLGQTWMISGCLPKDSTKTAAEIARACYAALMPDARWEQDLQGQGKLMGADIFEISQYRIIMKEDTTRDATIQDIQNSDHIIIIIYPDLETAEQAAELYSDWIKMFGYRHKILWCYGQTRLLKKDLKSDFTTVKYGQSLIKEGSEKGREIEALSNMLEVVQDRFYSYTIDLDNLDFQRQTIDINLDDYNKQVVWLEKKSFGQKAESQTDIKLLNKFGEIAKNKYRLQISKDIEYLEKGMKLLKEVINAAVSRVEVEKAARDQKFQEIATLLGVGWAVGSVVADQQPETTHQLSVETLFSLETVLYYATVLMPPLCIAIGAAFLTWLIKRLLEK